MGTFRAGMTEVTDSAFTGWGKGGKCMGIWFKMA